MGIKSVRKIFLSIFVEYSKWMALIMHKDNFIAHLYVIFK